jgi:hypothetical protein
VNTPLKLGVYGVGLAAVFAAALGAGNLAGPDAVTAKPTGEHAGTGEHGEEGGHGGAAGPSKILPGGLQISQDGYTLVPEASTVPAGERTDFRFTVNGPDGKPVTRFTTLHGKQLHFIVARRDLSGFQHLHPKNVGDGVWSVPLKLAKPGAYRVFTDIQPHGVAKQLTLGMDVTAPGDYQPKALPKPVQTAKVGDYEVKLSGALIPGRTSKLTLSVSKDGKPVADLEPYLEAYGHLVALRAGDLAYLHVHPDGEPGDGKTPAGPEITFYAEVPSTGAYRLYLDFQHAGKVRTAEFTAVTADGAKLPPAPDGGEHAHTH